MQHAAAPASNGSVASGIEARGNTVLKPAEFLVETVEAGMGEVLVYVEDPEGHTEEVWSATQPLSGQGAEIHSVSGSVRPE